jgi:uncharacterized protein (DUF1778 family)
MSNKTVTFAARMRPEDRKQIAKRAAEVGMSQSDYVVMQALDWPGDGLRERVSDLEARVAQLEAKVPR